MTAPFPLIEISGSPLERGRQYGSQRTMTATVAMVLMEPAIGVMEVAPLPAIAPSFTTYRLERSAAAVPATR